MENLRNRVGDVNHDGHLDLIVTSSCESSSSQPHGVVGVLLGNGDKTFRSVRPYDSGGADARSVAVGDMNGDRNLDIPHREQLLQCRQLYEWRGRCFA